MIDVRPFCFRLPRPAPAATIDQPRLADVDAEALAILVPLLGCGEEAAALAFDGLADATDNGVTANALALIADEERTHEQLLVALAVRLPSPPLCQQPLMRAAQRFHVQLGRRDGALHLARIAGVDAAVCTILSRLLRPSAPIGADRVTRVLFSHIHSDEGRHVRVSRALARAMGDGRVIHDIAAGARAALADVLEPAANAFETLQVDPDTLFRDIRRLPNGMFAP